jgi:hypothetical protein
VSGWSGLWVRRWTGEANWGKSATSIGRSGLAAIQIKRPEAIILPVDLHSNGAFRLARVAEVQPDIIALDSSRAGGFRAAMFAPHRFYNLSLTGWTTEQMLDIFDRTTCQTRPRVVILEFD